MRLAGHVFDIINRDYRAARLKSMAATAIVRMLIMYGLLWFFKDK
jgi:hypothetical protein